MSIKGNKVLRVSTTVVWLPVLSSSSFERDGKPSRHQNSNPAVGVAGVLPGKLLSLSRNLHEEVSLHFLGSSPLTLEAKHGRVSRAGLQDGATQQQRENKNTRVFIIPTEGDTRLHRFHFLHCSKTTSCSRRRQDVGNTFTFHDDRTTQ